MYSALVGIALLAHISDSTRFERLDSALSQEARAGFSGVVLVGDSSGVKFERAYGNVKQIGAPADIPFWLASDSKQFTAAAILRLQQRGKLRVQDPIGRFFRDVPDDKRSITVHQLLSHTSGLPHVYQGDGIIDRDEAVASILRLQLRSKPGEKYFYSNDGYTLLASIVEIASNIPFDRYMIDSLMLPAG